MSTLIEIVHNTQLGVAIFLFVLTLVFIAGIIKATIDREIP